MPEAMTAKIVSDRLNRIEESMTMVLNAAGGKLKAEGKDVVDFGAGEPHFSTPQHIKDAAIAAIESNFTKYTNVAGIPELRQAVVTRHAKDFGSRYAVEEVCFSTGGKQALFNAIQVVVDHGDEVIIPVPYWVSFKDIVQYAGGKCVYVDTDESKNFSLTAEMVERAITPRTRAILLNSPNNPSGAVISPFDAQEITRLAHQRGIYVIADECYVYLNYTGMPYSLGSFHEGKEHVIVIGSLSKTYSMTGWRCGYSLAPKAVGAAIQKLQSQSTSNPNAVAQKAAVAALNGPQDCISEFKAEYLMLRDLVLKKAAQIPGMACNNPEGAFYVYPNVGKFLGKSGIKTTLDLSKRLLEEMFVVTVPGEAFGTKEHIRLSYAVKREDIARGMDRIKEFLGKL